MTATSDAVTSGLDRLGWTPARLWVAAVGVGANLSRRDVAAIAAGSQAASPVEHDVLVTALNDGFVDAGGNHPLPYWADLPG